MHAELNTREIDSSIIDNVISRYPDIKNIYSKQKTYTEINTYKNNSVNEKIVKQQIDLIFCTDKAKPIFKISFFFFILLKIRS